MRKILGFVVIFGLVSFDLYANAQYSLQKAKAQLVSDSMKLSVAYEQYIAVQADAQAKALRLLPGLSFDLLLADYQYTILRSIIPDPHRFFEASLVKDLSQAADLNRTIVKKNLLEDLEKTFFLHQFHKEMLQTFAKEVEIRADIAHRSQEAYDLGAIGFEEYYNSQRDVVAAKAQLASATELVKSEEFALRLLLEKDSDEGMEFVPEKLYNSDLEFPMGSDDAQAMALENSREIDQFDYLVAAAIKQKKGVALSWMSWNGVGFDYFARNAIARSEIRKLELQKNKTAVEIKNQVALQYAQVANLHEKIRLQVQLQAMAESHYSRALANYDHKLGTFISLKKSELSLMSTRRDGRRLQYELELKLIRLKRLVGANMLTNVMPRP